MKARAPIRTVVAASAIVAAILSSCARGRAPDSVGDPCRVDAECADGAYCSPFGACVVDCTASRPACTGDARCDLARGRCVDAHDAAVDAAFADGCGILEVTFKKRVPTMLLLIDQSGSMTSPFGASTRWDVVRDALVGPTGVVTALAMEIRFGATLFTSHGGFAGGTCPILTPPSPVFAIGARASIAANIDAHRPESDTPTGESIDAVATPLAAFAEPGPKVIVLATDGEPDTCATPNPSTEDAQQVALAAVETAFAKGIKTYVISVGTELTAAHQQQMANAGQGFPIDGGDGGPQAKVYRPADIAALHAAFDEVAYGVRSCIVDLDGKVRAPDQGIVKLDDLALVYADPNGWHMNGRSELELVGAACARLKSRDRDHDLRVAFPCGAILR